MGRHAGSPKWLPSDRGLVIIQTWEGFGALVVAIATMVIALVALGPSSTSGPSIAQAPLAVAAEMMQRLAVAVANAEADTAVTRVETMQRLTVALANAADDMAVTHEQMRRLGA